MQTPRPLLRSEDLPSPRPACSVLLEAGNVLLTGLFLELI